MMIIALDVCLHSTSSVGNGFCEDKANNARCDYDGGDCCMPSVQRGFCTECTCIQGAMIDDLFLRIYDNGTTDLYNYKGSAAQCSDLPQLTHLNEGSSVAVVQHKLIVYCSPDMTDEKGRTGLPF